MRASFRLHGSKSFPSFCLDHLHYPSYHKPSPTALTFLLSSLLFLFFLEHLFCPDLSVREECDEDPSQSDETEAEMSPPKSPSTPKNVKSKNSGTA